MIRSTLNKAKVCLIALASILPGLALGAQSTAKDGWDYQLPATEFTALCDQTLDQVRNDFKAIEDDTRPATLETVFGAAGSAPARDFIDRPFSTSAYIEFLNGLNSQSTKTQSR